MEVVKHEERRQILQLHGANGPPYEGTSTLFSMVREN